jgi:cytoskeletal protein CcmA (bactofilin family)
MMTMTTIGASLTIKGEVTSQEDVTVHGKLHGKITMTAGALLVAPQANVEAEVTVNRVKIEGCFSGDVSATERVELSQTANVSGTIVAPSVVIQDGAVFNGMIDINRKGSTIQQKKAS